MEFLAFDALLSMHLVCSCVECKLFPAHFRLLQVAYAFHIASNNIMYVCRNNGMLNGLCSGFCHRAGGGYAAFDALICTNH